MAKEGLDIRMTHQVAGIIQTEQGPMLAVPVDDKTVADMRTDNYFCVSYIVNKGQFFALKDQPAADQQDIKK